MKIYEKRPDSHIDKPHLNEKCSWTCRFVFMSDTETCAARLHTGFKISLGSEFGASLRETRVTSHESSEWNSIIHSRHLCPSIEQAKFCIDSMTGAPAMLPEWQLVAEPASTNVGQPFHGATTKCPCLPAEPSGKSPPQQQGQKTPQCHRCPNGSGFSHQPACSLFAPFY